MQLIGEWINRWEPASDGTQYPGHSPATCGYNLKDIKVRYAKERPYKESVQCCHRDDNGSVSCGSRPAVGLMFGSEYLSDKSVSD